MLIETPSTKAAKYLAEKDFDRRMQRKLMCANFSITLLVIVLVMTIAYSIT